VVLEKTLKGLLYCKKIQPIYPKGNKSLVFIGRTGTEAENLIVCPPDAKNCHLNAQFQRRARRDKKAFFSDQSREIEENNRMGNSRFYSRKLEILSEHFMQR